MATIEERCYGYEPAASQLKKLKRQVKELQELVDHYEYVIGDLDLSIICMDEELEGAYEKINDRR